MNALVRTNGNYYPTLFDSFFGKNIFDHFFTPEIPASRPAMNVVEHEKGYRVEFAVPGMSKEDIKINVEDGRLLIKAEKKNITEDKGEKYSRKEFSYQSFSKVFTLPDTVNADQISAFYEAGVLSINLPKLEAPSSAPVREIKIG